MPCTRALEVEVDVEQDRTTGRDRAVAVLESQTLKPEPPQHPDARTWDGHFERLTENVSAYVDAAPVVLWAIDAGGTITLSQGRALENPGPAARRAGRERMCSRSTPSNQKSSTRFGKLSREQR